VNGTTASVLALFREELPAEPPEITAERQRVRAFIREATASGLMTPECDSWLSGFSPAFSREAGRRGWIGMTWPRRYGGRETSPSARFAVVEELLAAGAPVAAHWFSDRQIGPSLLRHGTPEQRDAFLPPMARGELWFCIGMSEPDSGSDLGSVRTRATRATRSGREGWIVNGSKIWTSHAQHAHHMLALVRTGAAGEPPKTSLTQLIVDMGTPGVTVRPIRMLDGREHFCEVFFDDVFVPGERVLGRAGEGWRQVLGELGFERSGPERFLSTFPLLTGVAGVAAQASHADRSAPDAEFGSLVARLLVLRAMSGRVGAHLDGAQAPGVQAAIVKDLGTRFENDSLDVARGLLGACPQPPPPAVRGLLGQAQAHAPGFTLRGGTNEIMRDIVARALGAP
jgi:acyl-CoA dehydrogenase